MPISQIPDSVTCVLTSCGRFDLLRVTLDSFLAHHRPARFIIAEDSADAAFADRIRERYPQVEVRLNEPRLGQHRSIDSAYGDVATPFIFHMEDDFRFDGPVDVVDAVALAGSDPNISSVCFRRFDTLKLRHRMFAKRFAHGAQTYARMDRAHRDWYGFSFNPGIVSRDFWLEAGPYADHRNERAMSRAMKERGFGVVFQLPGVAVHIGSGRSVADPARAGENRRISRRWFRRAPTA